jgi:hypothetical protein
MSASRPPPRPSTGVAAGAIVVLIVGFAATSVVILVAVLWLIGAAAVAFYVSMFLFTTSLPCPSLCKGGRTDGQTRGMGASCMTADRSPTGQSETIVSACPARHLLGTPRPLRHAAWSAGDVPVLEPGDRVRVATSDEGSMIVRHQQPLGGSTPSS